MGRLEARGIKRRCQNDGCALPFYDLNRAEAHCPNCGTAYVPPPSPKVSERYQRRSEQMRPRWDSGANQVVPREAIIAEAVDADAEAELPDAAGAEELLEVEEDEEAVKIEPETDGTVEN